MTLASGVSGRGFKSRRARYATTLAGAFPSKTEGMFLSILFAHHKALKELQNKIDQINKLLQEPNQSHLTQ